MIHADSIQVEIDNTRLRITPGMESLLAPVLRYQATHFVSGGSLGYQKVQRTIRLYGVDELERLLVPAGLVAVVLEMLSRAGHSVTIKDYRRSGIRFQPDEQLLQHVQGWEKELLQRVVREPRGLIEVRNLADAAHKVALLCRLYPRARIVIPVATRQRIGALHRHLDRLLDGAVNIFDDYTWPWTGGRLLCTLRLFDYRNSDDWDMVLFPDILHVDVTSHIQAVLTLDQQRIYGFIERGKILSAGQRLRVQALCGPVLHQVPDPRGIQASVHVLWCQPAWHPPIEESDSLKRKRSAYWHNIERNDMITAVASAFRAGDMQRLWEHGLLLAEEGGTLQPLGTPSVAILAESSEHGRELRRRLDGWNLWHAVPTSRTPHNLPPGVKSIWDLGILDRVIITLAEASRLESIYTDVLIIASGEGWPDALQGFPPHTWRADHQVLLVDLADDFDPVARQATLHRQRIYAMQGWNVSGAPAWMEQMT